MKTKTYITCFLITFASFLNAKSFDKTNFVANPMIQFNNWIEEAQKEELYLPEDAILSTASKDGTPFSRGITIQDIDEEGIVFYTNPSSGKWKQMEENPHAVLSFVYDNHQVTIKGIINLSSSCQNHSSEENKEFAWCSVKLIPYEAQFDQVDWLTNDYKVIQSMLYAKNGQNWELSKEPKKYILPVLKDFIARKI